MDHSTDGRLTKIFEAGKALREAQDAFADQDAAEARVAALVRAVDTAWGLANHDDDIDRLMRISELLADAGGALACQTLVRMLNHEDPTVRMDAGEGLLAIGREQYADVARAMEACVNEGKATAALAEVPYLLAELGEPGGVKLSLRLLKHADADVVAAAIECLATLGDPSALKEIEKLRADKRTVTVEEELESDELTVGDLATDAADHLRLLRD